MTAILASFAEHTGPLWIEWIIVQALGAFSVAYTLRISSAMLGTNDGKPLSEARSAPSLSKRSVVASRRRWLRGVESECGRTPKDVLSGAFKKLRRTASTNSFERMSSRFARTSPSQNRESGRREDAGSQDWGWRSVGNVASDVVRNAIVAAALAKAR